MVMENEHSEAYNLGYAEGKSAASWVFDGNTTEATYRYVLKGIEDGDPALYSMYDERIPNLSGEYSDDMTPVKLARDLDLDFFADAEAVDTACEDWQYGASDGFWHSVEEMARHALG
jgi:hypothetical protein